MYIKKSDKMINFIGILAWQQNQRSSPGNEAMHQTNIVDCGYDASFRLP